MMSLRMYLPPREDLPLLPNDYLDKLTIKGIPKLKGLHRVNLLIIFDEIIRNNNTPTTNLKQMKNSQTAEIEVQGTPAATTETKAPLTKEERAARKERKRLKAEKLAAKEAKESKSPKKDDKKTLSDKNAADVVEKITTEKDLKYVYPAECCEGKDLLEKRKKFRAGVRRKVETFTKTMEKLMQDEVKNKKEIKALDKEFTSFAKEVYVEPKKQLLHA